MGFVSPAWKGTENTIWLVVIAYELPLIETGGTNMKKTLLVVLGIVLALGLIAVAYADLKSKMDLKAGDEIYACNCGEACKCDTISQNPGKCTCGTDMQKVN
jgi:hypothetical protein